MEKEKRGKLKTILKSLNTASAAMMFISLVALIVLEGPSITGRSVTVSISNINAAEQPLALLSSILIAIVIVAAMLYLGTKLVENRV